MEAVSRARFVRMSARKVRRVAELVRGKKVNEAIEILNFVPKAAAIPLQKNHQIGRLQRPGGRRNRQGSSG